MNDALLSSILTAIVAGILYILKSAADARKKTSDASAENSVTLADSINKMADSNNRMADSNNELLRTTITAMSSAEIERSKQLAVLTDMTGQIHGLALSMSDQSKKVIAMDERLTPVMPLLITIGSQITSLTSSGQANADALKTLLSLFETAMTQLKTIAESLEDVKTELKKVNDNKDEKDIPTP